LPASSGSPKNSAKECQGGRDRASADLDVLGFGLDVGRPDHRRGSQVQHLGQSDDAPDEGQPEEPRPVHPAVEFLLAHGDPPIGATRGDRPPARAAHEDALDHGLAAIEEWLGGRGCERQQDQVGAAHKLIVRRAMRMNGDHKYGPGGPKSNSR
jgi:hypothetical protein